MKLNRNVIDEVQSNLEVAEKLYKDFAGKKREGGLCLSFYVKYLIVDDGQDRWLGEVEDYQSALDDVCKKAMEGKYGDDGISDAYSDLCSDCGAMYSRIGTGEYNGNIGELVAELGKTLSRGTIGEICEELGIDLDDAGIDLDEVCTEA